MTRTQPHIPLIALAAVIAVLALGAGSAHAAYSIARVGTELQLTGDDASDTVRIDRDVAGVLRVDVGGDGEFEHVGSSTVANTTRIVVSAAGGDDAVTLVEANGALVPSTITGGPGADVLTGGSLADLLAGEAGDDTLLGKGGLDELVGGADADSLTGGDANDVANGEAGDDTIVWNPGDDSDDVSGAEGRDRIQVNGGNGAEVFTVTRNAGMDGIAVNRVTPAAFTIDGVGIEDVDMRMNGGIDSFEGHNNLAGFVDTIQIDTGTGGLEVVNGSDVSDVLVAGPGSAAFAGEEGSDVYRWSSGDGGGDSVDLGPGTDDVSVTGSDNPEQFGAEVLADSLIVTIPTEATSLGAFGADRLVLDAAGGDDIYNPSATLTGIVAVDASGGPGADTLLGTDGPETLRGGEGDDTITARGGADALFGDAGIDTLAGGAGPDSFACGGFGDTLDATAEDSVAPDCLKPPDPVDGPGPDPDPGTLPAGFKGFSTPLVSGRARNLVVKVTNTHSAPITVRVGGTENASRSARTFRYRAVTRTIAAGATVKVTLRAPRKLTRLLRRNLARKHRIVRRPRIAVTNVTTNGKTTVRPRLVVRAR